MEGNPTECRSNGTRGFVSCNCALGYEGNQPDYCEPIDCGTSIAGLHPNASATCGGDTRYLGNNCTAVCNAGYIGSGVYSCDYFGVWQGDIQCVPVDCGPTLPSPSANASYSCSSTVFEGPPCVEQCETGFLGGEVAHVCGADGEWTGVLSCTPIDCGTLVLSDPYAHADCNSSTLGAVCEAFCNTDFIGGPASFTCDSNGQWQGFLACAGADCTRTITQSQGLDAHGVTRCRGDTTFGGRPCVATCAEGYEGDDVTFTCQKTGQWASNETMLCERVNCGSTLPNVANAEYNCTNTLYQDQCVATCKDGYIAQPANSSSFQCTAVKVWQGELNCSAVDCGPLGTLADIHGITTCSQHTTFDSDSSLSAKCVTACKPGYRFKAGVSIANHSIPSLSGVVEGAGYVCQSDATWAGPLSVCEPVPCPSLNADSTIYDIDCPAEKRVFAAEPCTLRCQLGYEPKNITFSLVCNELGEWDGDFQCNAAFVASSSSSSSTVPMVGGAVGGIFVLILLIALVVTYRNRRRKRTTVNKGIAPPRPKKVTPLTFESAYYEPDAIAMTANPLHRRYSESHTDDDVLTSTARF